MARISLRSFDLAEAFLSDCLRLTYIHTYVCAHTRKHSRVLKILHVCCKSFKWSSVSGGCMRWPGFWQGSQGEGFAAASLERSISARQTWRNQATGCVSHDRLSCQLTARSKHSPPFFNAMHINISERRHWMVAMRALLWVWPL